jgi:hypothetical protein
LQYSIAMVRGMPTETNDSNHNVRSCSPISFKSAMEAVCTLGNKNNNQGKQRKNNPVNEKSWFGEGKERKKKSERENKRQRETLKIQKNPDVPCFMQHAFLF